MEHEALVRVAVFVALFALFAGWEALSPRRARVLPRRRRWMTNWAIIALDTLTLRFMALALPLLAVGAAIDAGRQEIGLFNMLDWPAWIEALIAIALLDLAIWAQHLVSHKVPVLWRLHRVHHADRDFDVTTAIRFHPVEIALSMLWKIGLVYLLGPSALAVLMFEILLNGTTMFNHANIRLPRGWDRWLRLLLVTPDMHRVHHSVRREEHDSNYGFALSIWDRLFRTYVPRPRDGQEEMKIGLGWQDMSPTRLGWSLALPFRRE